MREYAEALLSVVCRHSRVANASEWDIFVSDVHNRIVDAGSARRCTTHHLQMRRHSTSRLSMQKKSSQSKHDRKASRKRCFFLFACAECLQSTLFYIKFTQTNRSSYETSTFIYCLRIPFRRCRCNCTGHKECIYALNSMMNQSAVGFPKARL